MALVTSKAVEIDGDHEFTMKRFKEASTYYLRVLDESPENTICRLKLARCYFNDGDYARAMAVFKPVLDDEKFEIPREFCGHVLWTLIHCGLFRGAGLMFHRFTISQQYQFSHGEVFVNMLKDYNLACSEYEAKEWEKASYILSKMVLSNCRNADIEALLADCLLEMRQWKLARESAEHILKTHPQHTFAQCVVRLCNIIEKDLDGTTSDLPLACDASSSGDRHVPLINKALARRRKQIEIGLYRHEGIEYFEEKNYEEAIHSFSRAIYKTPNSPKILDCLLYRAEAYFILSNIMSAAEDLDVIFQISPNNIQGLKLRLLVKMKQGDVQECERAILVLDDSAEEVKAYKRWKAKYTCAMTHFRNRWFGHAEIQLTAICDPVHCVNSELIGMLALCFFKSKEFKPAAACARLALELNPNDINGRMVEARLLMNEGKTEMAYTMLKKALTLDPDNNDLKKILNKAKMNQSVSEPPPPPPPPPKTRPMNPPSRPMNAPSKEEAGPTASGKIVIDYNLDYYKFLGLPRDASQAVIKKKVRYWLKRTHPDKGLNQDLDATRYVVQMNKTLLDPDRRREYTERLPRGNR